MALVLTIHQAGAWEHFCRKPRPGAPAVRISALDPHSRTGTSEYFNLSRGQVAPGQAVIGIGMLFVRCLADAAGTVLVEYPYKAVRGGWRMLEETIHPSVSTRELASSPSGQPTHGTASLPAGTASGK